MWVVKLGGSLANSEELPSWLEVIATTGAGRVVLVPGGGPWADEVREAQKRESFDDRVAHRKALLAMEQYGRVLAATRPGFVVASSIVEIRDVLKDGQVPVWMPYEMVVAEPSIPESWDVTSDSLGAWLADKLNASVLILVKSFAVGEPPPDFAEWVHRGWVDRWFMRIASGGRFRIRLLGQGDQRAVECMLAAAVPEMVTNGG